MEITRGRAGRGTSGKRKFWMITLLSGGFNYNHRLNAFKAQ